jgi:hypothetical protein
MYDGGVYKCGGILKKNFWKILVFIYKNNTMKKVIRLTESDLTRIVKRVIIEEDKEVSWLWKVKKKLKGVSEEQLDYNMRNNLPWDWKGTKEGYFEKMDPRKKHSGSN